MKPKISVIIPFYNAEDTLLRALESVPMGKDIQIILLDDGSTDGSWKLALEWWRSKAESCNRSTIHRWEDNKGVAATMNLGFSLAEGEYIVSLSSDDYYVTDFEQFRPYLDGKNDLVYFDLQVDDGSVWHVDEKTKKSLVGAVKFIRTAFLGKVRVPGRKYKEDAPFSKALQDKNPKEAFTGIVLKHYSWPRKGSLSWQAAQDYANDRAKYEKNLEFGTENE